ncbi:hypothetical protein CRG98_029703 [Punica granatum]|uniref:Uncharacterized protein n=1 Tax=Punica granatum TaxID=22663 RepID=A0A2I0J103_PUNGR|nr:hypothetical protein CRG98_029703 [Punica granatum]
MQEPRKSQRSGRSTESDIGRTYVFRPELPEIRCTSTDGRDDGKRGRALKCASVCAGAQAGAREREQACLSRRARVCMRVYTREQASARLGT